MSTNPKVRPDGLTRRQIQCFNNVIAVLREHGLEDLAQLVSAGGVRADRVFFDCTAAAEESIDACDGFKRWFYHYNHEDAIASWREQRGDASMQICLIRKNNRYRIEVDFDEANPGWDLVTLVRHGFEVTYNWLRKKRTNPFVIAAARGLARV